VKDLSRKKKNIFDQLYSKSVLESMLNQRTFGYQTDYPPQPEKCSIPSVVAYGWFLEPHNDHVIPTTSLSIICPPIINLP